MSAGRRGQVRSRLRALGPLELAVLEHLWTAGVADVSQVHRTLGRSREVRLNTIGSTLQRLHRKGLVRRSRVSRAYHYRCAMTRGAFFAQRMLEVVGGAHALSDSTLLEAFVDAVAAADPSVLDRLSSLIAARRDRLAERGSPSAGQRQRVRAHGDLGGSPPSPAAAVGAMRPREQMLTAERPRGTPFGMLARARTAGFVALTLVLGWHGMGAPLELAGSACACADELEAGETSRDAAEHGAHETCPPDCEDDCRCCGSVQMMAAAESWTVPSPSHADATGRARAAAGIASGETDGVFRPPRA